MTETTDPFVPPAADGLPLAALDSATEGADRLDASARTPYGRNLLAHALVQLARDGWLRTEPAAVPSAPADADLRRQLAASERIRENADFHLGQEMARRQLAEKETARLRAVVARLRQMTDHWEQQLPEVIRTPAVVSAIRAVLEAADDPSRVAVGAQQPETQADDKPAVCGGFQWIGQSFATCERCGQPAWDHDGEEVVAVDGAGPFDTRRTVRPWKPGEADAIRAKWGTPAAAVARQADTAGEQPAT